MEVVMTIQFLGAAGQVTGSMTLLEYKGKKILIDCGQFQGTPDEEALNFSNLPFKIGEIDSILLTHAHIDHSGRVPLLVRKGFNGKVFCTPPTSHLAEILLKDAGKIHETESVWENKKRQRAGLPPVKPLYSEDDAIEALQYLYTIPYHKTYTLSDGLRFMYVRAGHLLGSSTLILYYEDAGVEKTMVFSGDLGNGTNLLEMPPEMIEQANTLIIESTYGDRLHTEIELRAERLVDILIEATSKGGNVIIPSFAVGRTQEIIFELNHYITTHQDQKSIILRDIPIFVDSPMALEATKVYESHIPDMSELVRNYDVPPFKMPNLHLVTSIEASIALNHNPMPKVIISASGMCEAGRITHHLKHNLWRPNTHVVFIGYQAEGTLGRKILNGEKTLRILDADVHVNATIHDLHGFSGHADEAHLLNWIRPIKGLEQIFINHGELASRNSLAEEIQKIHSAEIHLPVIGDIFNL
jgi:metallo-beta-lactamase family protein